MKCDKLQQVENPIEWGLYYDKNEVDAAIDELKREHHRERHEYIDWVNRLQKENAEFKAMVATDNSEVIARLEAENMKLKSCIKCLVMRDLIKDCPEKNSVIEIVKEYK